MICLAAKLAGSVKSDRVCLALAFLQAHGETAPDLLHSRPLKIQFVKPFRRKLLPPAIGAVVTAVSGQGSRAIVFFTLLEAASSVGNLHAAHRPLGPARLKNTSLSIREHHLG